MRELKFRVWDKEFKRMKITGMGIYNGELTCDESCIIMQFTGLKDKNGKEIYEGDIVKWPYYKHFKTGEVAWGDCGFWIVGYLDVLSKYRAEEEIEVIGNIYETQTA